MPPRPALHRSVVVAVAIGGALGAATRYGLGVAFPDPVGIGFPWTTFVINVTGCLAIGILAATVDGPIARHPLIRPLLGSGFLGGYTTFSTYADQSRALAMNGRWPLAALYVGGTLVAALASTWLGLTVAGRRGR